MARPGSQRLTGWPVMWQHTLTSRTVFDAQGDAGSGQERLDAGFMAAMTGHNKHQVRLVTRCQQHSVITPLLWWAFMWAGATMIGGEADRLSQETKCFAMEKRFFTSGVKFTKHSYYLYLSIKVRIFCISENISYEWSYFFFLRLFWRQNLRRFSIPGKIIQIIKN